MSLFDLGYYQNRECRHQQQEGLKKTLSESTEKLFLSEVLILTRLTGSEKLKIIHL